MVPPSFSLSLSPPLFFPSFPPTMVLFIFYLMLWSPGNIHRPKADPHRCLRASPHDSALGSTSCKLLHLCIMSWLKLVKSVSPSHGSSAPTYSRWVTSKGLQLPGRDATQYLDWGFTPCQGNYLMCRGIANLGQRMLQGTCTQLRPSLLHLGLHLC